MRLSILLVAVSLSFLSVTAQDLGDRRIVLEELTIPGMPGVQSYAWGQNGDALYLDNVLLKGACAPIPEPGGALLIAAAGLALLLRRRGRS